MLKLLRVRIFYALLKPFSRAMRKRRMALFVRLIGLTPGMEILDLGGEPFIWNFINFPLNITCLNLPGIEFKDYPSHHKITYVEGDACSMPFFQPGDFDFIFSNSVIEHVGDLHRRKQFASEVIRLSDKYWIQTPSKYFPIEAHNGMPFWWFYPEFLRSYFLRKWKKSLPRWTKMVEETSVVGARELRQILPGCKIKYEYFLVFPKSLIAYSTGS